VKKNKNKSACSYVHRQESDVQCLAYIHASHHCSWTLLQILLEQPASGKHTPQVHKKPQEHRTYFAVGMLKKDAYAAMPKLEVVSNR